MSGDNLHGKQPNIRYNVDVQHHEEWEKMSVSEKIQVSIPSLNNWEKDFFKKINIV